MARLILASGSPRRRELLAQIGLPFVVQVREIDETPQPDEAPADYVRRLACGKAAVMAGDHPQDWVLAADTTVTCDGVIFGKPADQAEAMQMWQQLGGRWHQVLTGVAVAQTTRPPFSSTARTFIKQSKARCESVLGNPATRVILVWQ